MDLLLPLLILLPAGCLLAVGLVPSAWADRRATVMRTLVTRLAGFQVLACLTAFLLFGVEGHHQILARSAELPLLSLSISWDGISSLMLLLVAFVGWLICRYSIRYLDGEAGQGRYYRWTALTLGAVCTMVVSGNLALLLLCWTLVSLALHRLLLHYPERPGAQRAAWTKFVISRFGDLALLAALVLIYSELRTVEFPELFAAARASLEGAASTGAAVTAGIWLLVLGAAIKSAQFPFHTWLPETMETPTPVSALMHAGIINGGGFLMIRTSPLVVLGPEALAALAIIGAVTAAFAALVMLTQTSIKRTLAWSTIAQMGFMMLQCGLGAFSAAMLHIIAHSLYKSHAFLSSGSVLSVDPPALRESERKRSMVHEGIWLAGAAGVVVTSLLLTMVGFGLDPASKSGGYVLGCLFAVGLTHWLWRLMVTENVRAIAVGLAGTVLLSLVYAGGFAAVDKVVSPSVPSAASWPAWNLLPGVVALGVFAAALLLLALARGDRFRWLARLHVHVSNGFYVDTLARNLLRSANS